MNYNLPEMLHTLLHDKEVIVDLAQLPCFFWGGGVSYFFRQLKSQEAGE